jgi:hypothetical protein
VAEPAGERCRRLACRGGLGTSLQSPIHDCERRRIGAIAKSRRAHGVPCTNEDKRRAVDDRRGDCPAAAPLRDFDESKRPAGATPPTSSCNCRLAGPVPLRFSAMGPSETKESGILCTLTYPDRLRF